LGETDISETSFFLRQTFSRAQPPPPPKMKFSYPQDGGNTVPRNVGVNPQFEKR